MTTVLPSSAGDGPAKVDLSTDFCRLCGVRYLVNFTSAHHTSKRHVKNASIQEIRNSLERQKAEAELAALKLSFVSEDAWGTVDHSDDKVTKIKIEAGEIQRRGPLKLKASLKKEKAEADYIVEDVRFLGKIPAADKIFSTRIISQNQESEVVNVMITCDLPRELLGAYQNPIKFKLTRSGIEGERNLKDPDELKKIRPQVVAEEKRMRVLLKEDLDSGNHMEKFRLLMHLEELQAEVSIREYDMEHTNLRRVQSRSRWEMYEMKVAGLAEARPSVLRGDRIYVKPETGSDVHEYEGVVWEVKQESVVIVFAGQFRRSFSTQMEYGVRFTFNRMPFKLMQRAVQLSQELSLTPLLFPVKTNKNLEHDPLMKLELYDKKLADNPEQMEAVQHVLAGVNRPAPYIIFGPPGTGKTVTVVEAIKQVLKLESRCRVLACAPSNAAADLLCTRLLKHVETKKVLRLNAISRPESACPNDIMAVSNWSVYHAGFYFPSVEYMTKFRVIITTLTTAGRLATAKFTPGFFTQVFVDEAGQATEPETLTAVAGLVDLHKTGQSRKNRTGQVILAGDPKQLGPVLQSVKATENGLGRSLLERLMLDVDLYQKQANGHYDRRFLTKLVRNYRSHPEILRIPSDLFYDGELVACADEKRRSALADWSELPKKGVPILFHGVIGKDMREGNSPSFFNPAEIALLKENLVTLVHKFLRMNISKEYIDKLLDNGGVKDAEIGIIAPYRKQVEKIRNLLQGNLDKYGQISVGSVEEFQGAERRVILISTVRSNPQFLSTDAEFKLGFLTNPKRFNTAITRAKALLIIVGNPYVLERDEYWKKMLTYCVSRGAYRGVEYELSEESDSEGESEEESTLEDGEIREESTA